VGYQPHVSGVAQKGSDSAVAEVGKPIPYEQIIANTTSKTMNATLASGTMNATLASAQ
jgi:hypothetical protein